MIAALTPRKGTLALDKESVSVSASDTVVLRRSIRETPPSVNRSPTSIIKSVRTKKDNTTVG